MQSTFRNLRHLSVSLRDSWAGPHQFICRQISSELLSLQVHHGAIEDLSCLPKSIEHIRFIDVALDDLSPLASLPQLKAVNLTGSSIKKFSSITKLAHISVTDDKIRGLVDSRTL